MQQQLVILFLQLKTLILKLLNRLSGQHLIQSLKDLNPKKRTTYVHGKDVVKLMVRVHTLKLTYGHTLERGRSPALGRTVQRGLLVRMNWQDITVPTLGKRDLPALFVTRGS